MYNIKKIISKNLGKIFLLLSLDGKEGVILIILLLITFYLYKLPFITNLLNKYDITIDDWMLRKYDDTIIASLEKDVLDKIN